MFDKGIRRNHSKGETVKVKLGSNYRDQSQTQASKHMCCVWAQAISVIIEPFFLMCTFHFRCAYVVCANMPFVDYLDESESKEIY